MDDAAVSSLGEDDAAASRSDTTALGPGDAGADASAERAPPADAAARSDACGATSLPVSTECARDSDCTFGFRDACCGGTYYGLAKISADADRMNRACAAPLMCGGLGCANIARAEDHGSVHAPGDVRVACLQNTCRTWVQSGSFACGSQTCSADQYCERFGSGTSNSWALQACRALPRDCRACACLVSVDSGCSCSVVAGHLEVGCQAP